MTEFDRCDVLGVAMWCLQPITRIIRRDAEPIYSLKGFKTEGEGFRASFDRSDGQKLDIAIDRQSMRDGIRWATKALGKKVLNWRG